MNAKHGDTVRVHYTGSFEDGTVFDSSDGQDPLEFTIGAGQVIPGVEQAVVGMAQGEKKRETIAPARGYGDRRQELVFTVERDQLPPGNDVKVGDLLQVGFGDGRTAAVQVTGLDGASVTLDANHPLAGRTLLFDLELVSIT
jgi:peptidylprolyl isomerase